MHGTGLIALWGYASAVLSRGSPPPLYGLKSPQTMTHAGHVKTFIGVGTQGISRAATANLSSAGPDLLDLVRPPQWPYNFSRAFCYFFMPCS